MAHYTNKPLSEFVTKSQDWIVACVTLEHWDVELSSNNDKSFGRLQLFRFAKFDFLLMKIPSTGSAKTWSELSLGSRSCDHLPSTWVWVVRWISKYTNFYRVLFFSLNIRYMVDLLSFKVVYSLFVVRWSRNLLYNLSISLLDLHTHFVLDKEKCERVLDNLKL